jgi:hypothetical protein
MTKTKTSNQIKAYILRMGSKRTNAQMATTLGVPRMTFAGVLAGMKRNKQVKNNFLKTDIQNSILKRVNSKTKKRK